MPRSKLSTEERIQRRVNVVDAGYKTSCWLWSGPLRKDGYAHCSVGGKMMLVHRVAYELSIGPVSKTSDLDHLCRNRHCCNPDHLEPVTRRENIRRGGKGVLFTTCKNGHQVNAQNTYVDERGWWCRLCDRERSKPENKTEARKQSQARSHVRWISNNRAKWNAYCRTRRRTKAGQVALSDEVKIGGKV